MVYNNSYQQQFVPNQPQYSTVQASQVQNNVDRGGIVWVQGDAGARSFLVAPNQSVMLMDSEDSCFYIKSADASGMPLPLRTFDYKERVVEQRQQPAANQSRIDMSQYVTKDVFDSTIQNYESRISELMDRMDKLISDLEPVDVSTKKRK